jgi:hypothetical protein
MLVALGLSKMLSSAKAAKDTGMSQNRISRARFVIEERHIGRGRTFRAAPLLMHQPGGKHAHKSNVRVSGACLFSITFRKPFRQPLCKDIAL